MELTGRASLIDRQLRSNFARWRRARDDRGTMENQDIGACIGIVIAAMSATLPASAKIVEDNIAIPVEVLDIHGAAASGLILQARQRVVDLGDHAVAMWAVARGVIVLRRSGWRVNGGYRRSYTRRDYSTC